jgi:MSHA biogenesis protein MshP
MKSLRRLQQGFFAILAIVILVLFAIIGVYMSTQVTTTALGTSASYLGIQAWFAAKSGLEWGIHRALHGANCAASSSFTVGDFNVTVACSSAVVTEGPDTYTVYNLTSTASKGSPGDVLYVNRKAMASATLGP